MAIDLVLDRKHRRRYLKQRIGWVGSNFRGRLPSCINLKPSNLGCCCGRARGSKAILGVQKPMFQTHVIKISLFMRCREYARREGIMQSNLSSEENLVNQRLQCKTSKSNCHPKMLMLVSCPYSTKICTRTTIFSNVANSDDY